MQRGRKRLPAHPNVRLRIAGGLVDKRVVVSHPSEAGYEELFEKITSGIFPMGSQLPSEQALARQFGVSRPVVRQALQKLRSAGLVVSRRGAGSYVSCFETSEFRQADFEGRIAQCLSLYEFRLSVEPDIAALAAKGITRERLEAIDVMLRVDRAYIENNNMGDAADYNFHLSVAESSENPYFVNTVKVVEHDMKFNTFVIRNLKRTTTANLRLIITEYALIVDAIHRRNSKDAYNQMKIHLENSRNFLLDLNVNLLKGLGG